MRDRNLLCQPVIREIRELLGNFIIAIDIREESWNVMNV